MLLWLIVCFCGLCVWLMFIFVRRCRFKTAKLAHSSSTCCPLLSPTP